jgi:conjugal transfer pilus assembly protein TraV
MKRLKTVLSLLATVLTLSLGACSFSGLSGATSFSCKAPPGVTCESLSGVYENSIQGNLLWQRSQKGKTKEMSDNAPDKPAKAVPISVVTATGPEVVGAGAMPLRSEPRVLRIWVAPWTDADGDMQDESYTYTVVDDGRWMIENAREAISEKYNVTKPKAAMTSMSSEVKK